MPQVKDNAIKDAWYENKAKKEDGTPRLLNLGTITFKPGQKRFVRAISRLSSRFTNTAFVDALANGNLVVVTNEPVQKAEAQKPAPKVNIEPHEPRQVVMESGQIETIPVTAPSNKTRSELQAMPKDELIILAREKNLDTTGSKAQIIDRILVAAE
jgi:hypothetical protein